MHLITRWFNVQFPRRADLSGRPLGFLFVRKYADGRCSESGWYLPWAKSTKLVEQFEVVQRLGEIDQVREMNLQVARAAEDRKLAELPQGSKIVKRRTYVDRRVDLSGYPYQMLHAIWVQFPAAA